jgi:hypothetical protein
MRLPFSKTESEVRVERDPKTQELTLSLNDDLAMPVGNITVSVSSKLGTEAAIRLRDQIDALLAAGENQRAASSEGR